MRDPYSLLAGLAPLQASLVDVPDAVVVPVDGCRAAVRAADPVFTRGDGVFETLLVRDGVGCLLAEHLDRLERSAALAGLVAPPVDRWRAAALEAVAQWPHDGEAVLRLLLGRDSVAFAMVSAVPDRVAAVRGAGVSALTLQRPLLPLANAKSLSYSVNSAALRHAQRLGCDEAIFVDGSGAVLEGPRSAVLVAVAGVDGKTVLVTPDSSNILPSTTLRAVFSVAGSRGVECRYQRLEVADLVAAEGLWLLSSVTLVARVRVLDGIGLGAAASDAWLRGLVDAAVAQR